VKFNEAKRRILESLASGEFIHEFRNDGEKNLLKSELISNSQAVSIVARTTGQQATVSSHHFLNSVEVWVFRPVGWYVKFYFTDDSVFISFHESKE
jgi:hypothetical protein